MVVILGGTGDLIREFPGSQEDLANMEYVLGVVDNGLVIQGRTQIYVVDLRADYQNTVMRSSLRHEGTPYTTYEADLTDQNYVTGRGVLTPEAVYIPTRDGLVRFDTQTGKRLGAPLPWPTEMGGEVFGHLAVFTLPGGFTPDGSPNRYPTRSLAPGEVVEAPGGDGGETLVPTRRTFLAVTSHARVQLIEVE